MFRTQHIAYCERNFKFQKFLLFILLFLFSSFFLSAFATSDCKILSMSNSDTSLCGSLSGGGFPFSWFVERSDDLCCGLCLDVLKDPLQCKNGHMYCASCIKNAFKFQLKCPTCSVATSLQEMSECLYVKNKISELKVKYS